MINKTEINGLKSNHDNHEITENCHIPESASIVNFIGITKTFIRLHHIYNFLTMHTSKIHIIV